LPSRTLETGAPPRCEKWVSNSLDKQCEGFSPAAQSPFAHASSALGKYFVAMLVMLEKRGGNRHGAGSYTCPQILEVGTLAGIDHRQEH
jgi:hypothetical protein